MAQMSDRQRQIEGQFMGEYWALRKAIGTAEESEQYWEYVVNETTSLQDRYCKADPENSLYYRSIIFACVNDLDHKEAVGRRNMKHDKVVISSINALRMAAGLPELGVVKK